MFVNKVFIVATLAISAFAAPTFVDLEERAPQPGVKTAFTNLKHKIDQKIEHGKAQGLYKHATKVIGKNSQQVHATIATVNGHEIVEVTSVGGPAVTLATGKHGVKTTFAGHEWKIATATPTPSSSHSATPSVTKRAEDLEARKVHHKQKKSKAQQLADHANKVIGKKHHKHVHATIATVSGQEIVKVTSVGGPEITLATNGGVKTKFAGHEWHIATATPTPSTSHFVSSTHAPTATPSKRSIEEYIEAREIEARQHTNSSPATFTASKSMLTALAGVLGSIVMGAMVVL